MGTLFGLLVVGAVCYVFFFKKKEVSTKIGGLFGGGSGDSDADNSNKNDRLM